MDTGPGNHMGGATKGRRDMNSADSTTALTVETDGRALPAGLAGMEIAALTRAATRAMGSSSSEFARSTGDFAISNIGVSAAYGTEIGPEALLLNNSATYAGQKLPAGSISWGEPARVRVLDSTMWEREFFFHGKSFPTWQRQATAEELKTYKLPR